MFYDNRGFPDESEAYDELLHNIDGGVILRKKKFPTPPLDVEDPAFNWVYSDELHGDKLKTELDFLRRLPFLDLPCGLCFSDARQWLPFTQIFAPEKAKYLAEKALIVLLFSVLLLAFDRRR